MNDFDKWAEEKGLSESEKGVAESGWKAALAWKTSIEHCPKCVICGEQPVFDAGDVCAPCAYKKELTDAQCIAVFDEVKRSGITRDVKTDEQKCVIVRRGLKGRTP